MDSNKFKLIMTVLKFGLAIIGILLCLALFFGPNMEATLEDQINFREGTSLSLATTYTSFIFFAGIGLILFFFVLQLITNPKKTIMSIIGLVIATVLYIVLLMMGTSDTNESLVLLDPVSIETIGSTTAGIYTVLTGIGAGLLAVIIGPFMGRYRK
jgi:hypothetical protein